MEEHLGDSKALVGQPQDLLTCFVLSTEDHLLFRLVDRERSRQTKTQVSLCDHNSKVFSHLTEALFDGTEIWKNIIPHHSVFLPLQP